MIGAMAVDYDFCFTDSRRIGHYESYLRQYASETGGYIALAEKKKRFQRNCTRRIYRADDKGVSGPGLYSGL